MQPAKPQRRFHAYCIGAPKTGTTTIAAMFRRHYKAAHEPAALTTNRLVIAALEAKLKGDALTKIDPTFVNDRIWHHCRDLIEAFFPETVSRYESGRFSR
jgi:hypothetical protein